MKRPVLVWIVLLLLTGSVLLPASAQEPAVSVPDAPVRWDGQSRFNVLVLGMDRRPGARDNLNARTDAILIVSYDPQEPRIGVLDIPRDIHMAVIDVESELVRVNTLLVRGENRAEGYGPYFAMETLQLNFGMYIDAYLAFDFEAFIALIDALGGITVDVPYEIYDPTFPDMNYGYDPFYIAAGEQELDGRTALQYTRTRHGDNDYARGLRQLQVIQGVYERLSDPAMLQTMLGNAPQLLDDLEGHIYTNLAADQVVALGLAVMRVPPEALVMESLNQEYSYNYTYRGETVRIPDRERLPELLAAVFGEQYWR